LIYIFAGWEQLAIMLSTLATRHEKVAT